MIIKARGAKDFAMKYILQQINIGNFKIGSKLASERDLSEAIGVSRATLREAYFILEYRGVLKRAHGKNWLVLNSIDECEEHY